MQHNVIMVAHNGVSTELNSKSGGGRMQFIFKPLVSMFVALPRVVINAAEERSSHTARNAMVIGVSSNEIIVFLARGILDSLFNTLM